MLRLDFDRHLLLQFCGSAITDAWLLPYRKLDDTLGLTDTCADTLADAHGHATPSVAVRCVCRRPGLTRRISLSRSPSIEVITAVADVVDVAHEAVGFDKGRVRRRV